MRQPKAAYGGTASSTSSVTYLLIGLNVAMFLLTTATGTGFATGGTPSKVFRDLAMVPGFVALDGDYYRLLTATFLHYGILHIAFNMLCLYQLGPYLEQAFGRLRFTALYLLSGVGGSTLSYALGPINVQAAGASGAVFGLFAAFFVLQRKRGGDVSSITTTIAINLALSFGYASFIDWRGHVGGLVTGALLTGALVYAPPARRAVYQVAGFVLVAGLVLAVVSVRTSDVKQMFTLPPSSSASARDLGSTVQNAWPSASR